MGEITFIVGVSNTTLWQPFFLPKPRFFQKIQHKSGLSCQIKPVDGGHFRGESALSFYVHFIIAKFSASCLKNGIKWEIWGRKITYFKTAWKWFIQSKNGSLRLWRILKNTHFLLVSFYIWVINLSVNGCPKLQGGVLKYRERLGPYI